MKKETKKYESSRVLRETSYALKGKLALSQEKTLEDKVIFDKNTILFRNYFKVVNQKMVYQQIKIAKKFQYNTLGRNDGMNNNS